MPLYEYQCQQCESKFEVLQSISGADKELFCPDCGAERLEKLFSRFASMGASAKTSASAVCQTGST